jgi:dTDP-4-dehydrorhamnose reductase
MKILLTGSSGQLGSEIKKHALLRDIGLNVLSHQILKEIAICDLLKILNDIDVVIYCAANTNVDFCELNRGQCFFDNNILPMKLFNVANKESKKLVFISSSGVYGNTKENTPYTEDDLPHPTTNYHKAKFQTEVDLLINNSEALVIRLGWLYSANCFSQKNFIVNRLREAQHNYENGIPLYANVDQYGSPCNANNAAIRILDLLVDNKSGIYNCSDGGGAITRFRYVAEIMHAASFPIEVIPAPGKTFNRPAPVPLNESIVNHRMLKEGYSEMIDWQNAIKQCVANLLSTGAFKFP